MYKKIGIVVIALGVFLNEFTIKFISNNEVRFDDIKKSIIVIIVQLFIISIGIYILLKRKKAAHNILLLFVTLSTCMIVLEIVLSIPYFQNLSSDHPVWIPYKYKLLNTKINQIHFNYALKNKCGFNDINHSYKMSDTNQIRIAALGDSFIWGAGVPDSIIWTSKLKKMFERDNLSCEVLNWGKSGWSTLNEFNFLKYEGYKYQFDYLIFAFVVNDPVMDSSSFKQIIHQDGFIERHLIKPLSILFPNTISFFVDLTNDVFSDYSDYGYMNWLNNKVYININLENYSNLLLEIKKYCTKRDIKFSFIMTPENHNTLLNKYFEKIIPLFEKNKISFFNLYPYVKKELKNYSNRELWANPGDGHPGSLVTSVYSEYIYTYLTTKLVK